MKRQSTLYVLLVLLLSVSASAQTHPDMFSITVDGDALHLEHINAYYDCDQTGITYEATVYEHELWVQEHEDPEGGLSECDCHYDLSATFSNVHPGTWEVTVFWLDETLGDWDMKTLPVDVPDVGQVDPLVVGPVTQSECYGGTTDSLVRDWGALKALYR